jgi:hypothetical protein
MGETVHGNHVLSQAVALYFKSALTVPVMVADSMKICLELGDSGLNRRICTLMTIPVEEDAHFSLDD